MIPHDEYLDTLVTQGHRRTPRVEAFTLEGESLGVIPITGGSVSFDLTRTAGLRAGSLEVPGYEWAPHSETDPLAPFGQYVTVTYDYSYDTSEAGEAATVELGQFPIIGTEVRRPAEPVRVMLGDWAYRPQRALAESPIQLEATVTIAAAIVSLIQPALPFDLTVAVDDTGGDTIGGDGFIVNAGESPWDAAFNLADTHDCYLYLGRDPSQVFIVTAAGFAPSPVARIATGDGGVIVAMSADVNVLTACNRVVALAESSAEDGHTYRAVRTLTDGPMAYGSAFGRWPVVVSIRSDLATQQIADDLADYTFTRRAGAARIVTADIVPMPWLEPGDTVRVAGPTGEENIVLEQITIPLSTRAPETLTARAEQSQLPGRYGTGARFMGAN